MFPRANCDLWGRARQELHDPWHFHSDINFSLASDLVNVQTTDLCEQSRARNADGGFMQNCRLGERTLSKEQPSATTKKVFFRATILLGLQR